MASKTDTEHAKAIVRAFRPILRLADARIGGYFEDDVYVLTARKGSKLFRVIMDHTIAREAYDLHKQGESEYLVSLASFISWAVGEDVPYGEVLHIGFGS